MSNPAAQKLRRHCNSKHRRNRKKLLFKLQDGMCSVCRHSMSLEIPYGDELYVNFEHLVCISESMNDTAGNLLLAHYKCNKDKLNRAPTDEECEFMAQIIVKRLNGQPIQGFRNLKISDERVIEYLKSSGIEYEDIL